MRTCASSTFSAFPHRGGRGVSFDDREADARSHIPGAVFARSHIPGAVFAGMASELSDPDHPVPDMLAPPERFAEVMGRLGIGPDTLVVAGDATGPPRGSARLWWALRYHGHEKVRVLEPFRSTRSRGRWSKRLKICNLERVRAVFLDYEKTERALDGGFLQWLIEGRPVSSDIPITEPATFTAKPRPELMASKQDVLAAMGRTDTVILDCLIAEQYDSTSETDVWGERGGHIPGAVNVPFFSSIDPALARAGAADRDRLRAEGRSFVLAPPETLAQVYGAVGARRDRHIITYCGCRLQRGAGAPRPHGPRLRGRPALRRLLGRVERRHVPVRRRRCRDGRLTQGSPTAAAHARRHRWPVHLEPITAPRNHGCGCDRLKSAELEHISPVRHDFA
jgi:3-mercaptopyruvate sulfurtransferase SseA